MTREKKVSESSETKAGTISDMARKLLLTGIGAIFMTEESIRGVLSEMKLPKEAVSYVFDQAKKQKDDLISAIAAEVSKFFSKIKVNEEIQKALSTLQIHIDAKLSFTPKGKPIPDNLKINIKEIEEEENE